MDQRFNIKRSLSRRFFRIVGHAYLLIVYYVWFKGMCRGRIIGEENVERNISAGFVLAANHVSILDPSILFGYFYFKHKIDVAFLSGQRNYRGWFTSGIHDASGSIKVRESGFAIGKDTLLQLSNVRVIGIFPEGGRSADGKLRRAKPGAVYISSRLNKPIVPAALNGFYDMWPKGRKLPRPARCTIIFGNEINWETIDTAANWSGELENRTRQLMAAVGGLLTRGPEN